MIIRIWHGWTAPQNADAYEALLENRVIPSIEARGIDGLEGPFVIRRAVGDEVEFVAVMTFRDERAVTEFGGADGASVVPPAARELLTRFDDHSAHYDLALGDVRVRRPGQG